MTTKSRKTVLESGSKDAQDISTETLKTLMSISCAFAGLCFAILALTIKGNLNSYTALQLILWLAVIAFACSGLRSADKLLDLLCTKTRAWPSDKFPLVVTDNRVKDSGNAAFYFFAGWALLAAAMFFLGREIQLPLWLVILGTGYMGFIDILFVTHKFALWS